MRLFALLSLALAAPAAAAPVAITVIGADGKPLAGAVVQVESARAPAASSVLKGPYEVAQSDISFQPHVLIVPVGAAVEFPNKDKVRHHVYSFSPAKKFELKLYGRGTGPLVTFDKPGVVALGCNIHDSMSGFVFVTASPYTAQTDAAGRVSFDVPAGSVRLTVWHPGIRTKGNTLSQPAAVGAGGLTTTLTVHR